MPPATFIRCLAVLSFAAAAFPTSAQEEPVWDGSRTVPVHRLPLFDENAQPIVPTLRESMPMSTRYTCGTCHAYETVSSGFHFQGRLPGNSDGRKGEPWVWVDRETGTALPVSQRDWEGTWSIEEIGMSPWRFTQVFGRHLPGGGVSEPEDIYAAGDRWAVSGAYEVNCMACHNLSPRQDMSEFAKHMMRDNFRWAATAASGIGEVTGVASRLPDHWTPTSGPNPDDQFWATPPSVNYDTTLFDSNGMHFFEVGAPLDRSCLHCHSTARVGIERWLHPEDAHTAAGLSCVNCHHNGLDHQIIRGYDGEAADRSLPQIAAFSCAGCHLGTGEDAPLDMRGGLHGAPYPAHRGIPEIHFEKLSCTACHSGAVIDGGPALVRTSRANRLGIHGRAQWFTTEPRIQEPVFVRNEKGVIEPHRLMWPSFWVRIEDGVTTPVTPDFVQPYTVGILDAARQARLVLDQVALIPSLEGTPLLGIDGKFFEIDPSDQIRPADAATTAPFTGTLWAQNIDGVAQPLIPDFDVTQEYLDYEVEDFLMAELLPALTQWRPYNGHPVLLHAGQLFWRDDDGILAREAAPETLTADHPQLLWRTPQGELIPMIDADTAAAIHATVGTDAEFTEAQVARVLARLQEDNPGACFGYVHGGILFQLAGQGDSLELKAEEAAIAAPYTWPLGHDVRPAAQSLGARGCVDCHATDSSFYFAEVTGDGPLLTQRASVLPMYDLQQVDEGFQKLFGRSFEMRQMFKVVGWAAAGVLTAILIVFAMMGLGRLARWIGGRD